MSASDRDRDADPADLARRLRRVRVVAHLGRQVERDRQAGLALLEQVAEPAVRLLGGREAGVLAHRPEPASGTSSAWTPRVNGDSPGRPRSRSGSKPSAVEVVGGVEVGDLEVASSSRTARGAPAPSRSAFARGRRRASARHRVAASLTRCTASRSPSSIVSPAPTATRSTRAGPRRPELVLHLHRLDDEQRRAGLDLVAGRDRDRGDPARDDRPGPRAARWPPPRRASRVARSPQRRPGRRPRPRARTASRRRRPRRPTGHPASRRAGPTVRPAVAAVGAVDDGTARRRAARRDLARVVGRDDDRPVGRQAAGERRRDADARRVIAATGRPPAPAVARPGRTAARRSAAVAGACRRSAAAGGGRGRRRPGRGLERAAARSASTIGAHSSATQSIDRSPARNPAWRATNRWNGSVVWMPVTTVSSRARAQPGDRRGPVGVDDHELGDERVVVRRDPVARPDAGVDPDARPGRHLPAADPARRRGEVAGRVLGREADLDRVAVGRRGALGRGEHARRQRAAGGDPELLADDVDAGDELGHAVLDLEPGVDLEEPEPAVRVEQELDGRGVDEPGRLARPGPPAAWSSRRCVLVRPGAGDSSTSFWWRRWSEQSRSPRATIVPVGVAEQLDLDVAGRPDLALEVDGAVAERRPRLGRAGGQRRGQLARPRRPGACPGRRRRPRP